MPRFSPTIQVMVKAAQKAARYLVRDFGELENLQVTNKGVQGFVTAADKKAEKIISEELEYARPGYSFLMEESKPVKGEEEDKCWIIDPIDGTHNFMRGIPHFCISIALEDKGEISHGVIYDPIKDELFYAEKGAGAFSGHQRLRVTNRKEIKGAAIAMSHICSEPKNIAQRRAEQHKIEDLGAENRFFFSGALDLAYVAAGRLDACWANPTNAWDCAAGYLLVKESGGFCSTFDGKNKYPIHSGEILAANANLMPLLVKALQN